MIKKEHKKNKKTITKLFTTFTHKAAAIHYGAIYGCAFMCLRHARSLVIVTGKRGK
jgi:hypothetical protein